MKLKRYINNLVRKNAKVNEPVPMEKDLCKKWKKYDTVLVPYDQYIAYCKMSGLPLERPKNW